MQITEIVKHLFILVVDAIWDKVNAINVGVGIGAIYLQVFIMSMPLDIIPLIQLGLTAGVSISLIVFNVVKTYLLWRKKDIDEE